MSGVDLSRDSSSPERAERFRRVVDFFDLTSHGTVVIHRSLQNRILSADRSPQDPWFIAFASRTDADSQGRVIQARDIISHADINGALGMVGVQTGIENGNPQELERLERIRAELEAFRRIAGGIF